MDIGRKSSAWTIPTPPLFRLQSPLQAPTILQKMGNRQSYLHSTADMRTLIAFQGHLLVLQLEILHDGVTEMTSLIHMDQVIFWVFDSQVGYLEVVFMLCSSKSQDPNTSSKCCEVGLWRSVAIVLFLLIRHFESITFNYHVFPSSIGITTDFDYCLFYLHLYHQISLGWK